MTDRHHLSDEPACTHHWHPEQHAVAATHVDVDGGGKVARAEVGDLGRHGLEIAQIRQCEEGRQLLEGFLLVGCRGPFHLQVVDLGLELLVLLTHRPVVHRAGQEAADGLHDGVHARADG